MNPEEGDSHENRPLELVARSRRRALLGSVGVFGVIGGLWAAITTVAPDFYASSSSPIAYLVTVGAVLLLFSALVVGQVSSIRAWFGSLAELDGVDPRRIRWFTRLAMICIVVGVLSAVAILLFTLLVWMPEVREIVNRG